MAAKLLQYCPAGEQYFKQTLEVEMVQPSSVVQISGSTKSLDTLLDGPTPWVRFPYKPILVYTISPLRKLPYSFQH